MQDGAPALEHHKIQLIKGLGTAAESLRNAATMAEGFAALLQHTSFGDNGITSPLNILSMLGGDGAHQLQMSANQTPGGKDGAEESGKKKRKAVKRKPKDPNAPKRPPSAYLLFQNEVRKEMQAKFPNTPYHTVLSKISERWATMTEDDKEVYKQATSDAKTRYNETKAAYDAGGTNGAVAKVAPVTPVAPVAPVAPAEVKAIKAAPPIASTDDSSEEESDGGSSSQEGSEDDEEEDQKPPPKKAKLQKEPVPKTSPAHASKEKEKKKTKV